MHFYRSNWQRARIISEDGVFWLYGEKSLALAQFETPKVLANSSPVVRAKREPWVSITDTFQP